MKIFHFPQFNNLTDAQWNFRSHGAGKGKVGKTSALPCSLEVTLFRHQYTLFIYKTSLEWGRNQGGRRPLNSFSQWTVLSKAMSINSNLKKIPEVALIFLPRYSGWSECLLTSHAITLSIFSSSIFKAHISNFFFCLRAFSGLTSPLFPVLH